MAIRSAFVLAYIVAEEEEAEEEQSKEKEEEGRVHERFCRVLCCCKVLFFNRDFFQPYQQQLIIKGQLDWRLSASGGGATRLARPMSAAREQGD